MTRTLERKKKKARKEKTMFRISGRFWPTLNLLMIHRLVETHIFSFVVGRAFVTDIEKLKISSKTRSLDVVQVLRFFSDVQKVCILMFVWLDLLPLWDGLFYEIKFVRTSFQDGISPGSNLLTAVEVLVSGVYSCTLLAQHNFLLSSRKNLYVHTRKKRWSIFSLDLLSMYLISLFFINPKSIILLPVYVLSLNQSKLCHSLT